jgi:hypothetical protein
LSRVNYHQPRQLMREGRPSGRWHYTNMRAGITTPEGYCADLTSPCHADGHATKDEAYACMKRYLLDTTLTFFDDNPDAEHQHKCQHETCKVFTSGGARVGHGIAHEWSLCPAHRTREVVDLLLVVGDSMGSF